MSSTKVGQLLKSQGYSLQVNRKTIEGKQHPDRDAQFEHIVAGIQAYYRTGQPTISVDTKKKNLGNMKNPGQTYGKKQRPFHLLTLNNNDPEVLQGVAEFVLKTGPFQEGIQCRKVFSFESWVDFTGDFDEHADIHPPIKRAHVFPFLNTLCVSLSPFLVQEASSSCSVNFAGEGSPSSNCWW